MSARMKIKKRKAFFLDLKLSQKHTATVYKVQCKRKFEWKNLLIPMTLSVLSLLPLLSSLMANTFERAFRIIYWIVFIVWLIHMPIYECILSNMLFFSSFISFAFECGLSIILHANHRLVLHIPFGLICMNHTVVTRTKVFACKLMARMRSKCSILCVHVCVCVANRAFGSLRAIVRIYEWIVYFGA